MYEVKLIRPNSFNYGVFATETIRRYTLIETSIAMILSENDLSGPLESYVFGLESLPGQAVLCMSNMSFLNSCGTKKDDDEFGFMGEESVGVTYEAMIGPKCKLHIYALKNIYKKQQLLLDYSNPWYDCISTKQVKKRD